MKKMLENSVVWDQEGAALPSVLIVITIISLMAGIVMSGMVIQSRFIQQDIDNLQARYTAEGAIFKFLAADTSVITDSTLVMLPDSSSAVIHSERFGGFLKIISTAHIGNQQKRVQVLAGRKPDSAYDYAVVLGDVHSRLNLAGNAHITGDIRVGPLGVKRSSFKGKLFKGTFEGTVHKIPDSTLPRYDDTFYKKELSKYRNWVENPPKVVRSVKPGRYRASRLFRSHTDYILYSEGDLEIHTTKETELPDSLAIIAAGNLVLDGDLYYRPFTRFVAGKKMTIGGNLKGKHGLFAAEEIFVGDRVYCSGQFLAEKKIMLSNRAYLQYPSVLYMQSRIEGNRRKGRIELAQSSVLDGLALLPLPEIALVDDEALIVVGDNASIRGGIYNTAKTELHGSIFGSVITFQFYFYNSPTAYINWLKDNTVNISQRPDHFTVPLGFSNGDSFEILDWREL